MVLVALRRNREKESVVNPASLLASASSVVLNAITKAGATLEEAQMVEAAVVSFVKLAEQTGQSDEAKLAAVLNATEAYVNTALPQLKVDFNTLSVQVKSFVAGVVSLWQALGVFAGDVVKDVAGVGETIVKAIEPAPAAPSPLTPAE
jgi:DNA-binding transcriptional regulator YhcF (GntR family)